MEAVKNVFKEVTSSDKSETEEKVYLLGFMPLNEVSGLVLGELGESLDLDRIKKLWLPKTQKAAELSMLDVRLLDDDKMKEIVKDVDPKYSKKIESIENKLLLNPFWKANKHSFKMVKIDELITLQGFINIERASKLAKRISKDATVSELLDYTIDLNRKPDAINRHQISNNAFLFSTKNHDIRLGKIEVRQIPQYDEREGNSTHTVPALVIPIIEGDPIIYCLRTYNFIPMPDGTQKKNYYLTLQNGFHRAYALRSLGIEYMPCIVIDPISFDETTMLQGRWSQERKTQEVSPRPPLMKDFFNPELIEKFKVRKTDLCIKVAWTIEKFTT